MLSSIPSKSKTIELKAVNVVLEKLKIEKKVIMTLFDTYFNRKEGEELEKLNALGGDTYILEELAVDKQNGVPSHEVLGRKKIYGENMRKKMKHRTLTKSLFENFKSDLLIKLLLAAGIVSIIVNTVSAENQDILDYCWVEGCALFVSAFIILLTNSINDWKQHQQFELIEGELYKKSEVSVIRDGKICIVLPSEIVAGDVFLLSSGMEIPADSYLIEGYDVIMDESSLTGESDQIVKNRLQECLTVYNFRKSRKDPLGDHDIPSPLLLSGTKVVSGEGKCIALAVGTAASVNLIQNKTTEDNKVSPLKMRLHLLSLELSKVGLFLSSIVLTVFLIRFIIDRATTDYWDHAVHWSEMIGFVIISVVVLVVSIPEGLAISVNIALSFSMGKMLNDKNLVRKIDGCETMGICNNICTDKTGTITENQLKVEGLWNLKFQSENELIPFLSKTTNYKTLLSESLACNNTAYLVPKVSGSKTEVGLLNFLSKNNINYQELRDSRIPGNKQLIRFPFTSRRRKMGTVVACENNIMRLHEKGSPETILYSCSDFHSMEKDAVLPLTNELKGEIKAAIEDLTEKGYRLLCLAYKSVQNNNDFQEKDSHSGIYTIENSDFVLLGLVAMRDKIRENVKSAVESCQKAGIKVRMITGDNKKTAIRYAKEVGIFSEKSLALDGNEFVALTGGVVCSNCRIHECPCERDLEHAIRDKSVYRIDTIANRKEFERIVDYLDVVSRATPEDKYAMVIGLKQIGGIVAVTGDGANDAMAMKAANVAFAMGETGTAIARDASSIVLMDDNFDSLIKAVVWGRNIGEGVQKFLQFQLTVNFSLTILTIVGAAVMKQPVLSAVQMLWVNLIMDSLASLMLATDEPEPGLLERKPEGKLRDIITPVVYQLIIVLIFVFYGPRFIPEQEDEIDRRIGFVKDIKYTQNTKNIRSGIILRIDRDEWDYGRYVADWGYSRHFTMVFNLFVLLQFFNFFCCRKIHDEANFFRGSFKNRYFRTILAVLVVLQALFVEFGRRALCCYTHGLSIPQWGYCVGFASFTWFLNFVLKCVDEEKLMKRLKQKNEKDENIKEKAPLLAKEADNEAINVK